MSSGNFIVKAKSYEEIAEEIIWHSTKENLTITSAKSVVLQGKDGGMEFKDYNPIKLRKYILDGWWTNEKDERITEAQVGDEVRFHIETKDIPDGKIIYISLYDDDKRIGLHEDKKDDHIKLCTQDGKGKPVTFWKVKSNKAVIPIHLNEGLVSLIKAEPDKQIELYFRCSYNAKDDLPENVDLPNKAKDYLKVLEPEPVVVFVNGYWNKGRLKGMAGSEYGENYWGSSFKNRTKLYFNSQKIFFINGAGEKGDGGAKRFRMGGELAKERFNNQQSEFYKKVLSISKNSKGEYTKDIVFVSHSMGSAFAEGMINYLYSKGVRIKKVIHFSPADNSGFSITLPDITYQIDISNDAVLLYKNFDDSKYIQGIKNACLVSNPDGEGWNGMQYGHANTKWEGYVWNWVEDLESMQIAHARTSYVTGGYGGTVPIELFKTITKHNTLFIRFLIKGEGYLSRDYNLGNSVVNNEYFKGNY